MLIRTLLTHTYAFIKLFMRLTIVSNEKNARTTSFDVTMIVFSACLVVR